MSNLNLWSQFDVTPSQYKKNFRKGGFQGTSFNPNWMIKKLTEVFGVIGCGWGYEILKDEYIDASVNKDNSYVVHKILLKFWYIYQGEKQEFTHFGLTNFCYQTKEGYLFVDEDHAKKSLTDAISKCATMLGFAADIYMNEQNHPNTSNKYMIETPEPKKISLPPKPVTAPKVTAKDVTLDQLIAWKSDLLMIDQTEEIKKKIAGIEAEISKRKIEAPISTEPDLID